MKKYNSSQVKFATIIVTLFALAPLAHSAVISGVASTVINTGGVMHTETKVGTTATTGVKIVGGAKMEDGTLEVKTETQHSLGTKGDAIENPEMNANVNALSALEKAELHIDLDEEDKNDEGKGDIDVASDVHSELDFKHFVARKAKADAHIKSVDVKDGKVEVRYKESGKWFGFISADIEAKVSADVKGDVEVAYPWYHIFMKANHSSASLQSEIARAVAAERKGEKEGVSSTTLRAEISAAFGVPNLFEIIANTLKKTSASANTTTEV